MVWRRTGSEEGFLLVLVLVLVLVLSVQCSVLVGGLGLGIELKSGLRRGAGNLGCGGSEGDESGEGGG